MYWQDRTELLIGKENLEKLKNSRVLVCGLGGVGGAAAEQLVRAGVGIIGIVDADVINISNINRQIIATHDNLGEYKTSEYIKRFRLINPEIEIIEKRVYLRDKVLENVLLEGWDYVVDAIDTLSPKLNLLRICYQNKINVISSLGSGGKTDPTRVKIDDISKSYNCGLARMLRKRLHRLGIYSGIEVVFSDEEVLKTSVVEEESVNKKSNIGTISYMPIVFGCFCASVVIRRLCGII